MLGTKLCEEGAALRRKGIMFVLEVIGGRKSSMVSGEFAAAEAGAASSLRFTGEQGRRHLRNDISARSSLQDWKGDA